MVPSRVNASLLCLCILHCTSLAFQQSPVFPGNVAARSRALLRHRYSAVSDGNATNAADETHASPILSSQRRSILFGMGLTSSLAAGGGDASAVFQFGGSGKQSSLFFVSPGRNSSDSLQREQVFAEPYALSTEICLLKLLPVKNPVFRQLEKKIEGLSSLRKASLTSSEPWEQSRESMLNAIDTIDNKRNQIEPVFDPEDSAALQIFKSERGEQQIEVLRGHLVEIVNATTARNATETFLVQKRALLALADVGELLVPTFPYDVPAEEKFSYLPRLLGRAKVTFTIRRRKKILGNLTIVADGFLAPITAGNFVDLSLRNFYTGLPVKLTRKKVGKGGNFELATIPVLGSFQEGFYDPLTAKLRRIPLEIIRLEEGGKAAPKLSYAEDDVTSDLAPFGFSDKPASVSTESGKSLLSFDIPGLVALSHPDKILNGGSSEFFSLQLDSLPDSKRRLLDGEYAPFAYIVDGYDIFLSLLPGDIIDNTFVDELGQLNLVKLRKSSFQEVVQSGSESEPTKEETEEKAK